MKRPGFDEFLGLKCCVSGFMAVRHRTMRAEIMRGEAKPSIPANRSYFALSEKRFEFLRSGVGAGRSNAYEARSAKRVCVNDTHPRRSAVIIARAAGDQRFAMQYSA